MVLGSSNHFVSSGICGSRFHVVRGTIDGEVESVYRGGSRGQVLMSVVGSSISRCCTWVSILSALGDGWVGVE